MENIFKSISTAEAEKLIKEKQNDKNFAILDIRTENEFQSGAISNAINLDYYDSNFFEIIKTLDRNKTYLIYCRSGNRSKGALQMMQELKFEEVYELDGGIISFGNY